MGDPHALAVTERCSFSSSAPFAMRRSFRSVGTRGFVGTPAGSASIGAGKRPASGQAGGDRLGRGAHRLRAIGGGMSFIARSRQSPKDETRFPTVCGEEVSPLRDCHLRRGPHGRP
jgi:hypothetical protein